MTIGSVSQLTDGSQFGKDWDGNEQLAWRLPRIVSPGYS